MTAKFENGWLDMKLAPRDGTQILVAYNNDCFWEYFVVWWSAHEGTCFYHWQANNNSYPEDKFSAWKPLVDEPYEIK